MSAREIREPTGDLQPESGWEPCSLAGVFRPEHNFVSGDPRGSRIRVGYWLRSEDQVFVGKVWFGPDAEGPPLCAHGGAVAAVLDDTMGRAAWVAGFPVLAGGLEFRFLKRVPLGETLFLEGRIGERDGRKVTTEGFLRTPGGELLTRAEGLFLQVEATHFEAELRRLEEAGVSVENPTSRLVE